MNKLKFLSIIIFFSLISHIFLFSQLTDKWDIIDSKNALNNYALGTNPTLRNAALLDSNHYVAMGSFNTWEGEYIPN
ncbi:MAG TPA: hypothetical protein PKV40_07045, partial [Candidatus Kapabacteria bacterium]|nr:hypothetical protein [Candidatus Kapabacteria bacterium]